jgi:general secretion pathway protein M
VRFELSPTMRRVLALGLLLVAAALLWSVVAIPLLDAHREALSTIERLRPVIARGRTQVSEIAALQAELTRLKQRRNAAGGLLDGTNESIAAAQLQDRLKSAVDQVSGDLRSTQVLPVRDDAGFRRVSVRAELALNLAALQRIVYDLEASVPYLFVDNIDAIIRRPDPHQGGQGADDPVLDVHFDLIGYMRKPA